MTRRPNGSYQEEISVYVGGVKKRKFFYGKTKAEVLRKIAAFKDEQENGRRFSEVSEEWWTEAEPLLAYNTAKSYKPALVRADEHFGEWYIKKIKPADIALFLKHTIKSMHMADKTARTQLMVINLICKYAVSTGDLDFNPARDLSVPRGLTKQRREIADDDDIKKVKASTNCTFGMFAYWILYTGCRRGELMALTWNDVDLEHRTILINKSVYHDGNTPRLKDPKSSAGTREVPLLDKLYEKIVPGKGIIFPDSDGGYLTNMHFAALWDKYCEESGVKCTPHQLRHAYATMLFENDISESDAQALLGHAQISTTKDIYTHIRESRRQQIRAQLLDADI